MLAFIAPRLHVWRPSRRKEVVFAARRGAREYPRNFTPPLNKRASFSAHVVYAGGEEGVWGVWGGGELLPRNGPHPNSSLRKTSGRVSSPVIRAAVRLQGEARLTLSHPPFIEDGTFFFLIYIFYHESHLSIRHDIHLQCQI